MMAMAGIIDGIWPRRLAMVIFTAIILYPLVGLFAPVGPWNWEAGGAGTTVAAVRTSLVLTTIAIAIVVLLGTPVALHLARRAGPERIIWEAALLITVLMPPLALGVLLTLAFGGGVGIGPLLMRLGVPTSNTPAAFVVTQVYVSIGYYVVAARAAIDAVPRPLEQMAALLGLKPWAVFWRVTFPVARLGLAAAVSIAWLRALGEFGAIVVTAYYPAGMPVQIWVNLQQAGLPAVMPLLIIFLLTALPLPWLIHLFAGQRPLAG
jgi:molybdate/tungstate transport system permease protein